VVTDLPASFQSADSAGNDMPDSDYAGAYQRCSYCSHDTCTWDLYERSAWKSPYNLHSCKHTETRKQICCLHWNSYTGWLSNGYQDQDHPNQLQNRTIKIHANL